MEIHDSLNNQFKLYNYILKLNTSLQYYLENNNIDINYYCFFSNVIGKKHYIITSQTIKRKNNGYRLISIQDTEKGNNILECDNKLNIIFDNIHIKVTSIIDDITDVVKNLGIKIINCNALPISNQTMDHRKYYDKNCLESNILNMVDVMSLDIINNFENMAPNTLQSLTFNFNYDQIISKNVLPNSLRTLTFGNYYNQIIGEQVLPHWLQTLTFGNSYKQIIGVKVLPNLLHTLTLGHSYNQKINKTVLPSSLQTLTFGHSYNREIDKNVLPSSLQTLSFGHSYNRIINKKILPKLLQKLTFGHCYNRLINKNILPIYLRELTFGYSYNRMIDENVLPNSLQTLIFGYLYNQIINKNVLPNSLQTLTLGYSYGQLIGENVLPNSLHTIFFEGCNKYIIPLSFHNIIKVKPFNKFEQNTQ
jgi:hypothetical protein